MAKFKIRLRVQALELEIEGSRDDIPLMTENIGQQFAGLLSPAANIVDAQHPSDGASQPPPPESGQTTEPQKPKRSRKKQPATPSAGSTAPKDEPINWRHDPLKWGVPQQSWNTATKAIWLLYVVSRETSTADLSANVITVTFNKHFRQSGAIKNFNVTRDLGKLKATSTESPIGEDTTKNPPAWYLTVAGEKRAQELIAEALGKTENTSNTNQS